MKTEFLASVSHDLRTPLTSIVSFTELLREDIGGDDVDSQREFLDIISRNAERLLRLVGDLLLLGRIESNSLPLEFRTSRFPTSSTSRSAHTDPQAHAHDLPWMCQVTPGPDAPGGPGAPRSTRRGTSVECGEVHAGRGRASASAATTTGWPHRGRRHGGRRPAQTTSRACSTARSAGSNDRIAPGAGLGLAIAKGIAEIHGGTIAVASERGVSTSTFTIELPGDA